MASNQVNISYADRIVAHAAQRRASVRPTLPAQADSPTSVEAAERATNRAPADRVQVIEFLQGRGDEGATDEEMQLALGMGPSTQRPRRIELTKAGKVSDSGTTRLTLSGRRAVVWVAVE